MPSSTSTAPHVPHRLRRRLSHGSALGMGLLVASGAAAPAALAADEDPATGDATLQERPDPGQVDVGAALDEWDPAELTGEDLTADFGTGKIFGGTALTVSIDPVGRVPADLDLGGAVIAFRDVADDDGDDLAAWCVTDADGTCGVAHGGSEGSGDGTSLVSLPDGRYAIEQVAGAEGLAPAAGVLDTFDLGCAAESESPDLSCMFGRDHEIANDSLFSTGVTTTVVDGVSGAPVAGAGYRLSGPDHRHRAGGTPDDCQGDQPGGEQDPELPPLLLLLGVDPATPAGTGSADTAAESPDAAPVADPAAALPAAADPAAEDARAVEPGGTDPEPRGPAVAEGVDPTVATSDASGRLSHTGCLLPGTWTLEPVTTPRGHQPAGGTLQLPARDAGTGAYTPVAALTVELQPAADPSGPQTPPTTPPVPAPPAQPSGPPVPPATSTGSVATAPSAGTGGTGTGGTGTGTAGTGSGTGTGTGGGRPAAGAAAVPSAASGPASASSAAAPTAAPVPTTRSTQPVQARPSSAAAATVQPTPALQTQSSSNVMQIGLVAFGIVLAGAVFFLVLLLRRRAREQRG